MIYVYLQFYLFWFDKAFLFNIKLIYYSYLYVFSRTCMSDAQFTVIMRLGIITRYVCKYFWAYRAATVKCSPGAVETAVISIWSVSYNDEIKFRLDNSHVPQAQERSFMRSEIDMKSQGISRLITFRFQTRQFGYLEKFSQYSNSVMWNSTGNGNGFFSCILFETPNVKCNAN